MIGCYVGIALGVVFTILGTVGYATGLEYGLSLIVLGIIIAVACAFYIFYKAQKIKRFQAENQRIQSVIEEFNSYLAGNNFTVTNRIGDFLLDNISKRWCVYLQHNIFDCAEISSASVNKNSSRTYSTVTHVNKNTSTYDVFIKTVNIDYPVVTIACGQNVANAEAICNTVKIIKKQLKDGSTF